LSDHQGKWVSLQAGGAEWQGKQPRVEKVTRKPQVPDEAETKRNPRARSAKLRVVERME
jgi:16S rRNA C1402 N4-methylase RsmH